MRLFILGGGGHSKVVSDAALLTGKWQSIHIVDPNQEPNLEIDSEKDAIFYEENDLFQTNFNSKKDVLFIGIGSSQIRSKLYSEHSKSDISFINIAHPTATLSKTIQVKEGSFFGPNSVVNAQANIGVCVIVNSAAVVEHDCIIGDFSHIAPRATIAGGVEVGRYTLIGGNSFINENIKIADNIIVGSGSVVPFDLLEAGTYVGNPVKKIK